MGTEVAAVAASADGSRKIDIYLASIAAASVCAGLAVLATNHYHDRARAALLRHRTLANRPAVLVTDLMALIVISNGLTCALAPRFTVECEIPTALGTVTKAIETTGVVEAVALMLLSTCAMTIASLYSWYIYQLGCKLSSMTIPKWKWYIVQAYIWVVDVLPWLVYHAYIQVTMRTGDFHIIQDKNRVFPWIALGFTVLAFVLHISLNVIMVFRFIRGIKELVQNTHILKEDRIAELHALSVKSVVYIVLSLFLYIYVWIAFMVYPINLKIYLTTTPYHLALLVILQFCFNSRFLAAPGPSCLQTVPAAAAAHEGQAEDEALPADSLGNMEIKIGEMVDTGDAPPLGAEGAFSPTSWWLFGSRQYREQQRLRQQQREEEELRRQQQQQRKRSPGSRERWRPWRLPEISHVFSNPWEIEKGMVFRISEVPSSAGMGPQQEQQQLPSSHGGGGGGGGARSSGGSMVSAVSSATTGSTADDDIATTAAVIHPERSMVSDTLLDSPASSRSSGSISSSSGAMESGGVVTRQSPRRRRPES